jgi:ribosomal-protein-alanine N-acetyltransferase
VIRELELHDLDQVLTIEKLQFNTPWTHRDFEHELTQNPFAQYLVSEEKGVVLAYLGLWFLGNHAQITNLATHPDHLRQGHAQALVHHALALATVQSLRNVNLEVRISNQAAQALYRKMGFQVEAVRKDYYPDTHEDALLMVRPLKEHKYETARD